MPGRLVTLADMGMTQMMGGTPLGVHMSRQSSSRTVAAGTVSPVSQNMGWRTHELVIVCPKGVPGIEDKNGGHGMALPPEMDERAIAALGGPTDLHVTTTRPEPGTPAVVADPTAAVTRPKMTSASAPWVGRTSFMGLLGGTGAPGCGAASGRGRSGACGWGL